MTDSFDEVSAKLKASFEADSKKFAEQQAKLQSGFALHDAKFKADLESLVPRKPAATPKTESPSRWNLARKCWAWFDRDAAAQRRGRHKPRADTRAADVNVPYWG